MTKTVFQTLGGLVANLANVFAEPPWPPIEPPPKRPTPKLFAEMLDVQAWAMQHLESYCQVLAAYGVQVYIEFVGDGLVRMQAWTGAETETLDVHLATIDTDEVTQFLERACRAIGIDITMGLDA